MANDTSAVVAQPVRDPATARRTLEIAIATLAVASLILQHGFELWRRFGQLFNWLDVLLAFGLVTILLAQLMTAKRWQDAIHERRFELLLLGGSALLLLLRPVLPDQLFADAFPGLDHRRDAESAFVVVQLFLLGNVCLQLLRLLQRIFVAGVRPEVVLAGSFAALILLGTLLLLLPTAAANPASPLNLRRRFRINLVAIKRAAADGYQHVTRQFDPVPLPTDVIRQGDTLALGGSVPDLANFMAMHE